MNGLDVVREVLAAVSTTGAFLVCLSWLIGNVYIAMNEE